MGEKQTYTEGGSAPRARLHRQGGVMKELDDIIWRLKNHYTNSEFEVWLHGPHPQLDNETPLSAMIRGRAHEVKAILDRLENEVHL